MGLHAAQPYELVSGVFHFPSQTATSDPMSNWLKVQISGTTMTYIFNQVTPGADGATRMIGNVTTTHGTPSYQLVINGVTFTVYPLVTGNVTGGSIYQENAGTGSWNLVGSHANNLVSSFQGDYIAWVQTMRGEGYAVGISTGAFQAFLDGLNTVPEGDWVGAGGTPGPSLPNPGGTGSTTTTIGGNTTTSTSGNATVTTNNDYQYTYTYNYTTNNTTTADPTDLTPVVNAVNAGTAATNANGQKLDTVNDKLDYLTGHVIDGNTAIVDAINGLDTGGGGGGIAGPVTGVDPGTTPDVGAAIGAGVTSGEGSAATKYGGVTGAMALSGQGNHSVTFAIPWVGGGSESYTINSLPESGSSLDSFRLILRTFLAVVIGLGFLFLVVKTLRFY